MVHPQRLMIFIDFWGRWGTFQVLDLVVLLKSLLICNEKMAWAFYSFFSATHAITLQCCPSNNLVFWGQWAGATTEETGERLERNEITVNVGYYSFWDQWQGSDGTKENLHLCFHCIPSQDEVRSLFLTYNPIWMGQSMPLKQSQVHLTGPKRQLEISMWYENVCKTWHCERAGWGC